MRAETIPSEQGEPVISKHGSQVGGHTPGPWRVEDYDLEPRYLAALPPMVLIRSSHPRSWWVALATLDSGDGFPSNPQERDANARLIAAAPDMLTALRSLVEADSEGHMMPKWLAKEARAAIAKATGER